MTMCKGKTYIKGVCDKCQHYVTECDPIVKTKFKEAQVVFNNYIFDEMEKLNLFRANEEALIKQRVTKLEGQRMHSAEIENTHAVWIGKLETAFAKLKLNHNNHFKAHEESMGQIQDDLKLETKHLNRRLVDAEAKIVSLQLKLEKHEAGTLCHTECPIKLECLTPVKRKRGRPKKATV